MTQSRRLKFLAASMWAFCIWVQVHVATTAQASQEVEHEAPHAQ